MDYMDEDPDDDIEYTVSSMQVGMHELIKWAAAGADVVISIDGQLVGRVIPYTEQPATPGRPLVTIHLPRDPQE